jgi:DNA repair exonuclease SbcCD ATPase subunit
MQIYAMKFFNFLRFGEKNNTIVFDLTTKQKDDLKDNKITIDEIYEAVMKNPVQHVKDVKQRGIEKLIGFTGVIGGDPDKSNGAGKSSILEGVCYAHYEKISRKTANTDKIEKAGLSVVTKINGEIPKNVRESYVEELFEEDGRIYRLKRGREFSKNQKSNTAIAEFELLNKNEIDSQEGHRSRDTKEAISDVITMDYDVFLSSQMFAQNDAGKYLMGTDKTRKEMLISLLRLENIVAGCLELIRERKNKQSKKVDSLEALIEMMEGKICEIYSKYSIVPSSIFESHMPEKTGIFIEQSISVQRGEIGHLTKQIEAKEKEILLLEKSDKLVKIDKIKEEGCELKKNKQNKESELVKQTQEWTKLLKETEDNITKKEKAYEKVISDMSEVEQKIERKGKDVTSFNEEEYNKNIAIIEKAKQVKPKYEENLKTALAERDNIVINLASSSLTIKRIDLDIFKLKGQLNNAKDEKFICKECQSIVTKDHLISKISENENQKIGILKEQDDGVVLKKAKEEEIKAINGKLDRINAYLVMEGKINASKAACAESKRQLVDLNGFLKTQKDLKETLKEEVNSLNLKKNEYLSKCEDIKKLFEKDINGLKSKIDSLVAEFKLALNDANKVQKEIEILKGEKTSIVQAITTLNEKIGSLSKDKENVIKQGVELDEKKISIATERKTLERYLVLEDIYGLEGIQTRIVKKYLPLLNVYIKEFLDILSEGELSVKMFINERSKVDVQIIGGTSDSYEMLSGGEKMVVRLATDIGLALLSFSRSAQKPEIICLDEIFSNLDESRTNSVFSMLKKLSDRFSRVLVISHKQEINKKIHSQVIIEKASGKFGLSEIRRIT